MVCIFWCNWSPFVWGEWLGPTGMDLPGLPFIPPCALGAHILLLQDSVYINIQLTIRLICVWEEPEYRPLCDLRCRLRDQVENYWRAYTQVLFLRKAELGFFHCLEIVTGWLVPSAGQKIPVQPGWYLPLARRSQYSLAGTFDCKRSHLLKTGFFREVRELKIQGKIEAVLYVF